MSTSQQTGLIVPAYAESVWCNDLFAAVKKLGPRCIVIANPHNGPGSESQDENGKTIEDYAKKYEPWIKLVHQNEGKVIGYVHTCWGLEKGFEREALQDAWGEDPRKVCRCIREKEDIVKDIENWYNSYEIDRNQWHKYYDIDGIFFDEVITLAELKWTPTVQLGDTGFKSFLGYYKDLNHIVYTNHTNPSTGLPSLGKPIVVFNCGSEPDKDYFEIGKLQNELTVLGVFENPAQRLRRWFFQSWPGKQPVQKTKGLGLTWSWETNLDSSELAQSLVLVYGTWGCMLGIPMEAPGILKLLKNAGVGWIYLTDDAYSSLPSYWDSLINSV